SEAGKKLRHAMNTLRDHSCGKMVWAGHNVRDDFCLLGIWDARLEYADDGGRAIARHTEANSLADDRWISLEGVRPETIREDDDPCSRRAVVSRPDEAPEHGMKTHHFEIRAADYASLHFARLAEADQSESNGGEFAEFAEALDASAQVLNLGYGECGVFVAY